MQQIATVEALRAAVRGAAWAALGGAIPPAGISAPAAARGFGKPAWPAWTADACAPIRRAGRPW